MQFLYLKGGASSGHTFDIVRGSVPMILMIFTAGLYSSDRMSDIELTLPGRLSLHQVCSFKALCLAFVNGKPLRESRFRSEQANCGIVKSGHFQSSSSEDLGQYGGERCDSAAVGRRM